MTTPLLPPAPQYTGLVGYGTFQSVSLLNTEQHFLTKTTLQMKSGLDTHITYKLTITDLGNEQTVRKANYFDVRSQRYAIAQNGKAVKTKWAFHFKRRCLGNAGLFRRWRSMVTQMDRQEGVWTPGPGRGEVRGSCIA